jgi:hypothetical protein
MSTLTNEEYDERKRFLEDLKRLVKEEQENIYRILKQSSEDFSENSNGIFFDLTKVKMDTFQKMKAYMEFCSKNRENFSIREEEERKAHEILSGHD